MTPRPGLKPLWKDRLAAAWILVLGLLSLFSMAAEMGMPAAGLGPVTTLFKAVYVVVLVGLIAGSVLMLTRRLRGG